MTTTTLPARTTTRPARRGTLRRISAIGRAELLLLWRNKTAMLYALTLPLCGVVVMRASGQADGAAAGIGPTLLATTTAFALLFVVYYNLVTAYVARRDEAVLQRLRTGELTDAEVLAGTAAPSVVLAWLQILVGGVAVAVFVGLPVPVNAVLLVLAVLLGTGIFVLLAAASTIFTRNVETAQITTMPVLVLPLFLSGLFQPISALPTWLEGIAQVLPLTPIVDLLRLGTVGLTPDGNELAGAGPDLIGTSIAAIGPTITALAWICIGIAIVRSRFRWGPRG